MALIVGGLVAVSAFVPFTIAHGPTSFNLGNKVLGWDMHRWGFVLGSVSPSLVGTGLWLLREVLAGGRRIALWALTAMCVVMFLVVVMTVLGQALGPPLELLFLPPASVLAAATTDRRGAIQALLAALAGAYAVALVLAVVPFSIPEPLGDFRIFGMVAYAGVGALWATLGVVVLGSE
jgi:hypothetical protein